MVGYLLSKSTGIVVVDDDFRVILNDIRVFRAYPFSLCFDKRDISLSIFLKTGQTQLARRIANNLRNVLYVGVAKKNRQEQSREKFLAKKSESRQDNTVIFIIAR